MIIPLLAAFASAGGSTAVVYQAVGGSISSNEDDGNTVNSQLLYDLDGGVRKRTETNVLAPFYTNLAPWSSLEPNETDGANWHVWLEYTSGNTLSPGGDALDTWLPLSLDRMWSFSWTDGGPSTAQGIYLVKISNDGGASDFDTAVVTLNMEVFTL